MQEPPSIDLPADVRIHNPLITPQGLRLLDGLKKHPHAPRFNHVAGDRLFAEDLEALSAFRESLARSAAASPTTRPPDHVLARIRELIPRVPLFRQHVPDGHDLAATWQQVPTTSREDIAVRPELLVPDDADLDKLIVYRTAGTTGHALLVPHSPQSAACYQPLLEHALSLYGIGVPFQPTEVACFLVGAQAHTVTYPTVLAAWNGAGFVKLNLSLAEWPSAQSPGKYFAAFQPRLLTGDPISFAEMLRMGISAQPAAIFSTAVAMSRGLKRRLAQAYRCPVIDLYSLTETGPIACWDPGCEGYRVLPNDIFVEAVDAQGRQVPDGRRGEITVTGGRNPFLPLLRYRTGDWGRIERGLDKSGTPVVRILDLEGRQPVLFRGGDGAIVNPVDISRVLREFPFVQHEFAQHADRSCELVARPIPGVQPNRRDIEAALRTLLGPSTALTIRFDASLGDRASGGKVTPYRSELLLEE